MAADDARAQLESALEGIHGWLTPDEAWQMHEEVRRVAERAGRPLTIVEIGSWKGRSAIAMGRALHASGHGGTIHCIDPQAPPFDNAAEFDANVERAGVSDLIRPVRALSHEARPSFEPTEVDVLFVDGAHDFPSVARDLDDWTPLLVHGSLLVANDLFLPGVSFALKDRVAVVGSPFRHPRYVYNTIFFDHEPRRPWSDRDTGECRRCRLFLTAGRLWLRAWTRIKDDPRIPVGVKSGFFRPTSRLLWRLGPKPR